MPMTPVQVWAEIASRVQACLAKERNTEIQDKPDLTVSMSTRPPKSPQEKNMTCCFNNITDRFSLLYGEFVLTCGVSDLFAIVLLACGVTQPVNQFNKQTLFSMSVAFNFYNKINSS